MQNRSLSSAFSTWRFASLASFFSILALSATALQIGLQWQAY